MPEEVGSLTVRITPVLDREAHARAKEELSRLAGSAPGGGRSPTADDIARGGGGGVGFVDSRLGGGGGGPPRDPREFASTYALGRERARLESGIAGRLAFSSGMLEHSRFQYASMRAEHDDIDRRINRKEPVTGDQIRRYQEIAPMLRGQEGFLRRVEQDVVRDQRIMGEMGQRAYAHQDSQANAAAAKDETRLRQQLNDALRMEEQGRRQIAANTKQQASQQQRLNSAQFQASIAHLSPTGQRDALLERAGSIGDPMERARLEQQAGRLAPKTGQHRSVMSTGMFMNVLFGGSELLKAFSASNAIGGTPEGSSPSVSVNAWPDHLHAAMLLTFLPIARRTRM